jgi:hypothetical protein
MSRSALLPTLLALGTPMALLGVPRESTAPAIKTGNGPRVRNTARSGYAMRVNAFAKHDDITTKYTKETNAHSRS